MSIQATTDFLKLVQHAAGAIEVVSGERNPGSAEASEPKRPYFRVQFLRLDGQTDVPGRLQGVALISCFGRDFVDAWAKGPALTKALKLSRQGFQVPDYPNPSAVLDYEPVGDGWQRGQDPKGGGMVYTSLMFRYPDTGA